MPPERSRKPARDRSSEAPDADGKKAPVERTRFGRSRDGEAREFGRDGISGLVNADRAVRAREVSRPGRDDVLAAELVVASLVARASGRRR